MARGSEGRRGDTGGTQRESRSCRKASADGTCEYRRCRGRRRRHWSHRSRSRRRRDSHDHWGHQVWRRRGRGSATADRTAGPQRVSADRIDVGGGGRVDPTGDRRRIGSAVHEQRGNAGPPEHHHNALRGRALGVKCTREINPEGVDRIRASRVRRHDRQKERLKNRVRCGLRHTRPSGAKRSGVVRLSAAGTPRIISYAANSRAKLMGAVG
jgi:hypothetical protein